MKIHTSAFRSVLPKPKRFSPNAISYEHVENITYNLVKTTSGNEDYLDEVQNVKHGNANTKLILSNDSLMI